MPDWTMASISDLPFVVDPSAMQSSFMQLQPILPWTLCAFSVNGLFEWLVKTWILTFAAMQQEARSDTSKSSNIAQTAKVTLRLWPLVSKSVVPSESLEMFGLI